MSEKRFTLMLPNAIINDTIVRKSYYLSEKEDVEKVVDLLNEQQSTITALKEENEKLKITLSEYGVDFSSLDRFKEAIGYNEMVKKVLNDE